MRLPPRTRRNPSKAAGTDATTSEQTLANNSRLVVIDQGGGPYRVLYVSGRPNWEFKFLRRALEEDDQLELAGLVRIATRQPKFDFRSQRTQSTSPLFDGFDHPDAETAERSDQPVLIRLGKKLDGVELRDGFPKTADELYRYHAIVLDDLEAAFFTPDQLALSAEFREPARGWAADAGGPRFVRERQVRPHSDRRAVARLSESARRGPGGAGVSPGAHARRLAATVGSIAETEKRRAPAAGRDDAVSDAQPRR